MSSTAAEPGTSAEDQAYFRALEDLFLRLRGSATLLAAADWHVAREWRHAGIPIELIAEVMQRLFDRQRERAPKRGISSLRYFRAAVASAWDEALALRAGGFRDAAAERPVPERLEALAAALPEDLPGRAELAEEILALRGSVSTVEPKLAKIDTALIARLEAGLAPEARAALALETERALAPLRRRLSESAARAGEERLRIQALRRRYRLPLLSLFAPEAAAPESGEDDPAVG
jgi:hypothetical protein